MAKHRMHRGLVALSATAIAAVYAVGLIHTQPAAALVGAQGAAPTAAQATSVAHVAPTVQIAASPPTPTTQISSIPSAPAAPPQSTRPFEPAEGGRGRSRGGFGAQEPARTAPIAAQVPPGPAPAPAAASPGPAVAAATPYKDGTYSGMGTSRFGNVELAVTVASGRITEVTLTRVTTKYPASRIAGLPGQVLARQSGQVDNVSGATASAQAFRTAVQQALGQASAA